MKLREINVGIDACKKGWIIIQIDQNYSYKWDVISNIEELFIESNPIYIDIPIGLADTNVKREIDQIAKSKLKPYKASSIFIPPNRNAIYASSYIEAKQINIKETGKSISIQSWNICPKIKEVDRFIQKIKGGNPFKESHPELCFTILNAGKPLKSKKSAIEGQNDRLNLLSKYYTKTLVLFNEISSNTLRKNVKPDDILDAMCLAISALISNEKPMKKITGTHLVDSNGIEIALYYPQIGEKIPKE
jgi:predicted RNase H-like nuclease